MNGRILDPWSVDPVVKKVLTMENIETRRIEWSNTILKHCVLRWYINASSITSCFEFHKKIFLLDAVQDNLIPTEQPPTNVPH